MFIKSKEVDYYNKKIIMVLTLVVFSFATFSSAPLAALAALAASKIQEESSISIQNGITEVLVGTNENWSKLKVVDENGVTEIIEREIVEGRETFNIFTEDNILTHTVVSDGEGNILVDGELLEKQSEKVLIKKFDIDTMAIIDPGTGFYLISEVRSSYASDWGVLSLAIAILTSMFGGMPVGIASSFATGIIGARIPEVWYHERKYSDKKAYRPTIKVYVTHYADPRRTQYLGSTDYSY